MGVKSSERETKMNNELDLRVYIGFCGHRNFVAMFPPKFWPIKKSGFRRIILNFKIRSVGKRINSNLNLR